MTTLTHEILTELNQPVPRYTSYPTAPNWGFFSDDSYKEALQKSKGTLSLYFHIPFCRTMCLYCGCSVILNRKQENEEKYVRYLQKEIELVAASLPTDEVAEIHFGGGTPTQLSIEQFEALFKTIRSCFSLTPEVEIAIEIDPRTVGDGKKLQALQELGINRVSFGVQDTDPKVQRAVRRDQSLEVTRSTFLEARKLKFQSINIDLIYGLPFQTIKTFEKTCLDIIQLYPDRIALFSYAQVPWLKPHQKAIPQETLPTTEEKFSIYLLARKLFREAGYLQIGMDHFSAAHDSLAKAYHTKTLHRNFQGYSTFQANHLVGFGVTAIGTVNDCFVQNAKELDRYYQMLDEGKLCVVKGLALTEEDAIRRAIILELMCHFQVDKRRFFTTYGHDFDTLFQHEKEKALKLPGLVVDTEEKLIVTTQGELFIRNIASCFDAYLTCNDLKFSKSV